LEITSCCEPARGNSRWPIYSLRIALSLFISLYEDAKIDMTKPVTAYPAHCINGQRTKVQSSETLPVYDSSTEAREVNMPLKMARAVQVGGPAWHGGNFSKVVRQFKWGEKKR
jgi:hypothetical protein